MVINMNIGGTEKALLNMISEMSLKKYEITILMLESCGGFLQAIPDGINVEIVKGYHKFKEILHKPPKLMVINLIKEMKLFRAIYLSFIYFVVKLTKNRAFLFKYILKNVPVNNTKYDIAVAYAGPMDLISYFIVEKVKAKKRFQWIHFDVEKIGFDKNFVKNYYSFYNKLYIVSEEAKNKFIDQFPSFINKTHVFNNLISLNEIYNQSTKGKGFSDDFDGIRILTVGRLALEKGQDIAIEAFVKLIKKGHNIRWYCIGDGYARQTYESLIRKYELKDSFILLGANSNPYPYIKNCDLYVQPSRYEGFCLTLMEAKSLLKPIISTDVNGVRELIIDGKTGLIVDIDKNNLFKAIDNLISDKSLQQKFVNNLSKQQKNFKSYRNFIKSVF